MIEDSEDSVKLYRRLFKLRLTMWTDSPRVVWDMIDLMFDSDYPHYVGETQRVEYPELDPDVNVILEGAEDWLETATERKARMELREARLADASSLDIDFADPATAEGTNPNLVDNRYSEQINPSR